MSTTSVKEYRTMLEEIASAEYTPEEAIGELQAVFAGLIEDCSTSKNKAQVSAYRALIAQIETNITELNETVAGSKKPVRGTTKKGDKKPPTTPPTTEEKVYAVGDTISLDEELIDSTWELIKITSKKYYVWEDITENGKGRGDVLITNEPSGDFLVSFDKKFKAKIIA